MQFNFVSGEVPTQVSYWITYQKLHLSVSILNHKSQACSVLHAVDSSVDYGAAVTPWENRPGGLLWGLSDWYRTTVFDSCYDNWWSICNKELTARLILLSTYLFHIWQYFLYNSSFRRISISSSPTDFFPRLTTMTKVPILQSNYLLN